MPLLTITPRHIITRATTDIIRPATPAVTAVVEEATEEVAEAINLPPLNTKNSTGFPAEFLFSYV